MALLAIDTSSSVCVLGVQAGNETWVDETDLGRSHSQEILPRIEALLSSSGVSKKDLTTIIYGRGPGSFTGLRIGVGVVQGLAYGLEIPVVGVSSLACLAQQALNESDTSGGVLVALAARNTEVYFGAYEGLDAGVQLIGQEGVFEASEIPAQNPELMWLGIGDGWVHEAELKDASRVTVQAVNSSPRLRARELLDLGQIAQGQGLAKPAAEALPEYLREQVAAKPANK